MLVVRRDEDLADIERLDASIAQTFDETCRHGWREQRLFATVRIVEHRAVLCDHEVEEPKLWTNATQLGEPTSRDENGATPRRRKSRDRMLSCIGSSIFARCGPIEVHGACQVSHRK